MRPRQAANGTGGGGGGGRDGQAGGGEGGAGEVELPWPLPLLIKVLPPQLLVMIGTASISYTSSLRPHTLVA